jgi:hypothetical protein
LPVGIAPSVLRAWHEAHIRHKNIRQVCAAAKLAHGFIENNLTHTVEMLQLDKRIARIEAFSQDRDLTHGRGPIEHDFFFFLSALDEQRLPLRAAHVFNPACEVSGVRFQLRSRGPVVTP